MKRFSRFRVVGQILVITDQESIEQEVKVLEEKSVLSRNTVEPERTGWQKWLPQFKYDVIVNLQFDEIPQHPGLLDDLILPFWHLRRGGTLKGNYTELQDLTNPSIVKVVTDINGQALYLRSPDVSGAMGYTFREITHIAYMHLGVYIFRKSDYTICRVTIRIS